MVLSFDKLDCQEFPLQPSGKTGGPKPSPPSHFQTTKTTTIGDTADPSHDHTAPYKPLTPSDTRETANMSDAGEVEVESQSGYAVLPKEVTEEIGSIKLFNKWSYEDVEIRDISLT